MWIAVLLKEWRERAFEVGGRLRERVDDIAVERVKKRTRRCIVATTAKGVDLSQQSFSFVL